MRVKKMAKTSMKTSFLILSIIASFNTFASIAPISHTKSEDSVNSQIVSLNMQFKSRNKVVKSDLAMPFYQTAELEKKVDNKNVLIEVNPRRGKNSNEVEIELKFYKASGARAFAKKEIVAKLGEESKVSVKGLTVRVTPALN
jgi:hypothetical protein